MPGIECSICHGTVHCTHFISIAICDVFKFDKTVDAACSAFVCDACLKAGFNLAVVGARDEKAGGLMSVWYRSKDAAKYETVAIKSIEMKAKASHGIQATRSDPAELDVPQSGRSCGHCGPVPPAGELGAKDCEERHLP